ncbi:hypothetical protein OHD50_05980 [Escherichia coli]|nr:hypothetical protein [Escherichia coli]
MTSYSGTENNDPLLKKTRLYKAAQDIIWQESPIPLVVEKLVSVHSKT